MSRLSFRSVVLTAIATIGFSIAAPAYAQWIYTDPHGSFYSLTVGADTDASTTTETRLLTLTIDTTGNDDTTRFLDAAAIKVSSDYISSSLVAPTTGGYTFVDGGTSAAGCDGTGSGFMCASGHALLSSVGVFTFNWSVVMATGSLFAGDPNQPFSLKAVYDAGQTGRDGFYQVSVPLIPEPSTYALMLAGLGLVGFMARRRRSAT